MHRGLLLAAFISMSCAASCVVSSFDVDPAIGAAGGGSTSAAPAGGNASSAGNAGNAAGGKSSAGTTAGGTTAGGTTSGGTTSGGTAGSSPAVAGAAGGETAPGEAGAGGDNGSSGAAGASGASNAWRGPFRVGYSEFHDSAGGDDNASASLADATFKKPAGTLPGDFMLVFFGADDVLTNLGGSDLALRGWTLLDQHVQFGQDSQGMYLLYKRAGAAEPESIVFAGINPGGNGNGVQGLLSVYRNVNASTPINAYKTAVFSTGSETSIEVDTATPAITTSVDNCLLIAGLAPDTQIDAPVIKAWPLGFDRDLVSVINPETPYPFGWTNIYSAERRLAQAATVPGSTFTWDMTYGGMKYGGALSFVLALAP